MTSPNPIQMALVVGMPDEPFHQSVNLLRADTPRARTWHLPQTQRRTLDARFISVCRAKGVLVEVITSLADNPTLCCECTKFRNSGWPDRDAMIYFGAIDYMYTLWERLEAVETAFNHGESQLELIVELDDLFTEVTSPGRQTYWENSVEAVADGVEALDRYITVMRHRIEKLRPALLEASRHQKHDLVTLCSAVRLAAATSEAHHLQRRTMERTVEQHQPRADIVDDDLVVFDDVSPIIANKVLKLVSVWEVLRLDTTSPVDGKQVLHKALESLSMCRELQLQTLDNIPTEHLVFDPTMFGSPLAWAIAEWDAALQRATCRLVTHLEHRVQHYLNDVTKIVVVAPRMLHGRKFDQVLFAEVVAQSNNAVALRMPSACAQWLAHDVARSVFGAPIPGDIPDDVAALVVDLVDNSWGNPIVLAADALVIAQALTV